MDKTIRWGILGCGRIANKFASDLKLSSLGKLTACASTDPDKGSIFAKEWEVPYFFDHYDKLASSDKVDVIYIATPHSYHFAQTLLCLENNKAVLCEKPLAVNTKEVIKMISFAKEKNIFLMEAMWTRFLPNIIHIEKLISENHIGEIRHISANFGFKSEFSKDSRLYDLGLAGGSLLDIGIYPIFISLLLLGKPEIIKAFGSLSATGSDLECTITFSYKNGTSCQLYSTLSAHTNTDCTIYGTEGSIHIPGRFHEQNNGALIKNDLTKESFKFPKKGYGYIYEIEHVNQCLISVLIESPLHTFDNSLQIMEVMDEIRRQINVKYPVD